MNNKTNTMSSEIDFEMLRMDEDEFTERPCGTNLVSEKDAEEKPVAEVKPVVAAEVKTLPDFLVTTTAKCQKIRFANFTRQCWLGNKLQSDYAFDCRAIVAHGNYLILCSAKGSVENLPKEFDNTYCDNIKLAMKISIEKATNFGLESRLKHNGLTYENITVIPAEVFEKNKNDLLLHIKKLAAASFEKYGFADFFEYCMMDL